MNQKTVSSEPKILVYREYFARLLSAAKPLRDQLVIELPTLEAFRSGEVSSLRAEWVDVENGDIQVLDSKKGTMFTEPLDMTFGKHYLQYVAETGITKGILIQPLPTAHHIGRKLGSKTQGSGLSVTQLDRIWAKWCRACGIPVMPARMGRAYFASKWHFVDHKSLYGLMVMMRHTNLRVTEDYIEKFVDYPAVKAEFSQGQPLPFSLSSPCRFSQGCPLAAPGCRCRMFQSQLEVKPKL